MSADETPHDSEYEEVIMTTSSDHEDVSTNNKAVTMTTFLHQCPNLFRPHL